MPIYEYHCLECRKRVSVFFRTIREARDEDARCPLCQGAHMHRLQSRVAVLRSEESRLDALADNSLSGTLENDDPRAVARMVRTMSQEMGEPLEGEMAEVVGRLEAGESPEAIDAAMPNLSGDEPAG